jgi:ABC-type dipeptide/oligopeptide/nickel transport system permease component
MDGSKRHGLCNGWSCSSAILAWIGVTLHIWLSAAYFSTWIGAEPKLDRAASYNRWLEPIGADYVRTARAKGLRGMAVILRHALPNAITPIVTQVGLDMAYFLGGIVVVESVFGWPGIGQLAYQAIQNDDIPLILGTVLFSAIVIVLINIFIDVLYAVLNPRVVYS